MTLLEVLKSFQLCMTSSLIIKKEYKIMSEYKFGFRKKHATYLYLCY